MPRQARIIEEGGIYHVFNRGVEKRKIFLKNQDYSRFVISLEIFNCEEPVDLWNFLIQYRKDKNIKQLLAKKLKEQRAKKLPPIVEVLSFCLMPNHFHIVAREIVEGGISKFMQKIGGYCVYFNKQYNRVGSLFQSRFKSIKITSDQQLQAIFNYVHTNPVELIEPEWKKFRVEDIKKAIDFLDNYKWSSYLDYIGKSTHPYVIKKEFFRDCIGNQKKCKDFVEAWVKSRAKKIVDKDEIKSILLD